MNKSRRGPNQAKLWLIVAAFSVVIVPVGVFLGGLLLAGTYEGNAGVFGLIGGIYADALTGHLSALILLFSPLLLLLIWQLAIAAYGLISAKQELTRTGAPAQGQ